MNDLKLQKANDERVAAKNLADAQEFAKVLESKEVIVKLKTGEGGKTFESVSSKEIADEAKAQHDLDIDKKKILLESNIKTVGNYTVAVKISPEETAKITCGNAMRFYRISEDGTVMK